MKRIIYHASNQIVDAPKIFKRGYPKDFGYGFYCTNLYKQAANWIDSKFEHCGYINIYSYDEGLAKKKGLKILKFNPKDEEWLDFVNLCRSTYEGTPHDYDIVEGPMSDDKLYKYLKKIRQGIFFSRKKLWGVAEYKDENHQICFLSKKALSVLKYEGSEKYETKEL